MELKISSPALIWIGLLSIAAWIAFYVVSPSEPLRPQETLVVVLLMAGVVFGGSRAWRAFRQRNPRPSRPRKERSRGRRK